MRNHTEEAKSLAMATTMFHGCSWLEYLRPCCTSFAFAFNKGLPLSLRSAFYPIFGDRAWGWLGHVIDILAVLSTLFGLATHWVWVLSKRQVVSTMYLVLMVVSAPNDRDRLVTFIAVPVVRYRWWC
ncbi:BCCT family transporter [Vibrio sp.]|uniref:BCCT family transporter n=1 Tax=Vibrio sp. TaxID=678 RepID=UPI003AA835AB